MALEEEQHQEKVTPFIQFVSKTNIIRHVSSYRTSKGDQPIGNPVHN